MICQACSLAADMFMMVVHKRCTGCDCQHKPPVANPFKIALLDRGKRIAALSSLKIYPAVRPLLQELSEMEYPGDKSETEAGEGSQESVRATGFGSGDAGGEDGGSSLASPERTQLL